jgi:hypothetical protein
MLHNNINQTASRITASRMAFFRALQNFELLILISFETVKSVLIGGEQDFP